MLSTSREEKSCSVFRVRVVRDVSCENVRMTCVSGAGLCFSILSFDFHLFSLFFIFRSFHSSCLSCFSCF